jgi:hypothetical protein
MALPSEILATTLENRTKKVQDNVSNHNIVVNQLKEHGQINKNVGGRVFYKEINFAENGTFTRYVRAQTLNISLNQVATVAEFEPKNFALAVVLEGPERRQNSGKEQIINLLKNRIKVADITLENNFNADLFSDGTADGGKQIGGLKLLIAKTPTSGTVGGIDRSLSSNAWWRNYKFATATDWAGGALNVGNIQDRFGFVLDNTMQGMNGPKYAINGKTHYGLIRQVAQSRQLITDTKLAKLGFKNIVFCEIPCVLGASVNLGGQTLIADDQTYFIDPDGMSLDVQPSGYFERLPMVQSINQDAEAQLIIFQGNLTMNRAVTQATIFDS